MTIEVLLDRLVELEARERQALAAAERHPELGARVTRQVEAGGQRRQSQRGAVVVPELDDPRVPSHSRREAQLERTAGERGGQGCREGRGRVDDQQVACLEDARQVAERQMRE